MAATGGVSAATNYGSIPGEHPRRINLAQIAGVDPLAEKWFYEVPSFFPPQHMPSVAMAVASLDAYMFDDDGRYEFAVRATEYVAFEEVATAVRPRAFWRELTALQLRPMVVSGAVRVFYVAEVEPVDEPFWLDAPPCALDWEDFAQPVGCADCDLCGEPLPHGEGVQDWAGTGMHVCEHHEYALAVAVLGASMGGRTVSGSSGRRWLQGHSIHGPRGRCRSTRPRRGLAHLSSAGGAASQGRTDCVCWAGCGGCCSGCCDGHHHQKGEGERQSASPRHRHGKVRRAAR